MAELIARKRLSNEIWEQMLQRAEHKCLSCGVAAYPMSQDHVTSIVDGGTNDADNIQPLCLKCNLKKGDKSEDFRPSDWPWREAVATVVRLKRPGPEFLAGMTRLNSFMRQWRATNPRSSFVSASDPHIVWRRMGNTALGECSTCVMKVVLSEVQMAKSVDNWVSETHVAMHLATEMVNLAERLGEQAWTAFLPETE